MTVDKVKGKRQKATAPAEENLAAGLTDEQLALTPSCNTCGWRKGGKGSWSGRSCKCGESSPPFSALFASELVDR